MLWGVPKVFSAIVEIEVFSFNIAQVYKTLVFRFFGILSAVFSLNFHHMALDGVTLESG